MAVLIPLLWARFELPSLIQIGITVLVLIDPKTRTSRDKGKQRLYGCLLGGLVGLLAVALPGESLLLWLGNLFVAMFLFLRLHLSQSRWAYVGTQAAIAFLLCAITGTGPPDTIVPIVNRLGGILCGVVILMLVTKLVDGWFGPMRTQFRSRPGIDTSNRAA